MLTIETARVFETLLKPSSYKGAWDRRSSGKSHYMAGAVVEHCLLNLAAASSASERFRRLRPTVGTRKPRPLACLPLSGFFVCNVRREVARSETYRFNDESVSAAQMPAQGPERKTRSAEIRCSIGCHSCLGAARARDHPRGSFIIFKYPS
jgi:hypothetical protein